MKKNKQKMKEKEKEKEEGEKLTEEEEKNDPGNHLWEFFSDFKHNVWHLTEFFLFCNVKPS